MKLLSRVVWSEGMYLAPHHFQVQSRYFEDSIQFVTSSLRRDYYGFLACEMNAEALRNGTLALGRFTSVEWLAGLRLGRHFVW